MAQSRIVRGRATRVSQPDETGAINVRYHDTDVVRVFSDGSIRLDSGGWRTATTKLRMNQAASQFLLGFHVYQTNRQWFVQVAGQEAPFPFEDGMTFARPADVSPIYR